MLLDSSWDGRCWSRDNRIVLKSLCSSFTDYIFNMFMRKRKRKVDGPIPDRSPHAKKLNVGLFGDHDGKMCQLKKTEVRCRVNAMKTSVKVEY
eukprot:gene19117-6423_t